MCDEELNINEMPEICSLKVKRIFKGPKYTIGHLYVDGEYFCDTLEDVVRIKDGECSMKIYGETAIPEGTYLVEMFYWEKHKKIYPHIMDVPCFSGILIHGGIDQGDSEGCILIGENKVKGKLLYSAKHMDRLRKVLKDKIITIEII